MKTNWWAKWAWLLAAALACTAFPARADDDEGDAAAEEEAVPPKAKGPLNFIPLARRTQNETNLMQLHKLCLLYLNDNDRYPPSLKALVDDGYLADKQLAQASTRESSKEWRFDYGLLPKAAANEPGNRPLLWDKPGTWSDGGMVVTVDGGFHKFFGMKEDEWLRVHRALVGRKDRKFLEEKLPGMNFSGFKD